MLQKSSFASIWILVLSLCWCGLVAAQTKVVVVPLGGDDPKPLANIVTVAMANGDFTDPVAALASIDDADEDNPYLVAIAPGEYVLTAGQQLQMKPFVDIVGSGKNITRLIGTVAAATPTNAQALILGAANSQISSLSIENSGALADTSGGVFNGFGAVTTLSDVSIKVAGPGNNYGIDQNGGGKFSDLEIEVSGDLTQTGINLSSGSYTVENVTIECTIGASLIGVQAGSAGTEALVVRDSTVDATSAVTGYLAQRVYVSDSIIDGAITSASSKDCSFVFGPGGEVFEDDCDPAPS